MDTGYVRVSTQEQSPELQTDALELRDKIVDLWRLSGFPSMEDSDVVAIFNIDSRFEQLNIFAMARNELGHRPMLQNESWRSVRNPFMPGFGQ